MPVFSSSLRRNGVEDGQAPTQMPQDTHSDGLTCACGRKRQAHRCAAPSGSPRRGSPRRSARSRCNGRDRPRPAWPGATAAATASGRASARRRRETPRPRRCPTDRSADRAAGRTSRGRPRPAPWRDRRGPAITAGFHSETATQGNRATAIASMRGGFTFGREMRRMCTHMMNSRNSGTATCMNTISVKKRLVKRAGRR